MLRRHINSVFVFLLTGILLTSAVQGQQKRKFDLLGEEILQALQAFYPVRATEMGIHAYDSRLADYSDRAVNDMIKQINACQKKIYSYRNTDLNRYDNLNYNLLKSDLDVALLDLKQIAWHKKSPLLYVDEAVNGLYFLMISQHAPPESKLLPILERVRAVPALMKTGRQNIIHPPPIYIEAAVESLESGMNFYREAGGELMRQFPERADEILQVFTAAREAMNDFMIYLTELTPGDPRSFSIGKENFNYILSNQHFLEYDADSLLKLGEAWLAEAQQTYSDYKVEVEGGHQNGRDPVFVPAAFSRADVLDYYGWEVDRVKEFIQDHGLISVPQNIAPVKVVETPSFLQSMVAGIAYQPAGPFDSVQQGYFYVRPIPDSLDPAQLEARYRYVLRRGFKGSVVHEAFPGHHLQAQIAAQLPDPVRKWHGNNMFVEGWSLYCEEMMYDQGLYGDGDHAMWLAVLGGVRFRAARVVADVKLHTGQFTYDECVAWMQDVLEAETSSDKEYLAKEVRKMAHYPGVRMAYLTGKVEFVRLREAAEAKWGKEFTLKKFHDNVLSHGSVPPTLLWEAMDLSEFRHQVALEN